MIISDLKGYIAVSPATWAKVDSLIEPDSRKQPNRKLVNSILKQDGVKYKENPLNKTESVASIRWENQLIINWSPSE